MYKIADAGTVHFYPLYIYFISTIEQQIILPDVW